MYLGIDLGTGSAKVLLYDKSGRQTVRSKTYQIQAPKPGWAEIDPNAWLSAVRNALSELPDLKRVEAVGFSGQMHGFVPIKRKHGGIVNLAPAITWADRRGAQYVHTLEKLDPEIRRAIGNAPATGMAAVTALWLRDNAPTMFGKIDAILMAKDYVRAHLVEGLQTDFSDASGTLLYDFERRCWHFGVLEQLGIPKRILPDIVDGNAIVGAITKKAATRFGLPAGIPVVAGAGDTPAAAIGTGLRKSNAAQISIGTGAQISLSVPPKFMSSDQSLTLFEGAAANHRLLVAAVLNGGLVLEWVRRTLGFSWDDLYTRLEARGFEQSLDLVFVPYLSGERTPHMDAHARGSWTGLSLHHTREDLVLAALLGVASSVRLGFETLEKAAIKEITSIRVVGGSAGYPYWRRLLSALLGKEFHVSTVGNSSALGAVRLAAEATGGDHVPDPDFNVEPPAHIAWIDEYYERHRSTSDHIRQLSR